MYQRDGRDVDGTGIAVCFPSSPVASLFTLTSVWSSFWSWLSPADCQHCHNCNSSKGMGMGSADLVAISPFRHWSIENILRAFTIKKKANPNPNWSQERRHSIALMAVRWWRPRRPAANLSNCKSFRCHFSTFSFCCLYGLCGGFFRFVHM